MPVEEKHSIATDQSVDVESPPKSPDTDERRRRRFGRIVARVTVAMLGVAVGGHLTSDVGPLTLRIDLAYTGGANTLTVPPLWSVSVQPYLGPVGLEVTMIDIDAPAAKKLLKETSGLSIAEREIAADFERAAILLVVKTLLISLLFVALLSELLWRRPRAILLPTAIALALVVGSLTVSAATFDVKKTREPRFEGTIVQGSGVVGDVK